MDHHTQSDLIGVVVVSPEGSALNRAVFHGLLHQTYHADMICAAVHGQDDVVLSYRQAFEDIGAFFEIYDSGGASIVDAINSAIQRIAEQGYRYAIVLGPSAELSPCFLETIISAFAEHRDIGVLGGMMTAEGEENCIRSGAYFERPSFFPFYCHDSSLSIHDVEYIPSPVIAIRMTAVRQVGGINPVFSSLNYAFADLCFRMRRVGWRVSCLSTARYILRDACHSEDIRSVCFHMNRLMFAGLWLSPSLWDAFERSEYEILRDSHKNGYLGALLRAYVRLIDVFVNEKTSSYGLKNVLKLIEYGIDICNDAKSSSF